MPKKLLVQSSQSISFFRRIPIPEIVLGNALPTRIGNCHQQGIISIVPKTVMIDRDFHVAIKL
jgi:hypothetical protein